MEKHIAVVVDWYGPGSIRWENGSPSHPARVDRNLVVPEYILPSSLRVDIRASAMCVLQREMLRGGQFRKPITP
jgi:hypothetical protein